MPADIIDETGDASLAAAAERVAAALLELLERADCELTVVLVDDERIRELNAQWRGKDKATDVLSFSQLEGEGLPLASGLLGDVVVSAQKLRVQARDGGWTDEEELARLILHGLLHLLGFDHEVDEDARVMQAEERRLAFALHDRGIGCATG
ncbi:MAG TPA: rRNA maturation RNase YbeY [Candidatus Limnocylindrales bacterium]|nr:rRNA maturation RNase YbeY [Candidatus Limnocylindrales bacterium]